MIIESKYIMNTEEARSRNVSKYEKPIIDEIVLTTGETFTAIESQRLKDATEYISHGAISSFTVRNDELMKTSPAYYFSPEQKVKVER